MKKLLSALLGIFGLFIVPAYAALPTGYTELEYIESTGTQYIDTGVVPNQDYRFQVRAQFSSVTSGTIIGARTSASTHMFAIASTGTPPDRVYFNGGYGTWGGTTTNPTDTDIHTLDLNKNVFSIDGTVNKTFTAATVTPNTNAYLFVMNTGGSAGSGTYFNGRLYSAQIWNGSGTMVRDFVPARRNSDGVLGMYDTVSGTFFTNSGSGSFLPGEELDSCRNLFDKTNYTEINAFVNANTGVLTSGSSGSATQYSAVIPCKPNTTYTISGRGISSWGAFTSSDVGTTATSFSKVENGSITTGANDRYLIGLIRANSNTIDYRNDLQIEKGSTATPYVPYDPQCATCDGTIVNYTSATGTVSQSGTPTPNNPIDPVFFRQGDMILRAVGSGENLVADSYDASTGKITRRVGYHIFTGNENFSTSAAYGKALIIQSAAQPWGAQYKDKEVLCNYFKGMKTIESGDRALNTCFFNVSSHFYFRTESSAADFKTWLKGLYDAGTPVIVYYPLATPVVEDWTETSYCETPIKIATTKYNETKFSPLNTALQNAISVVDSVVSNTITQAASIATLQAQKQTRPNDIADDNEKCPAGKKCLLVEDASGVPHWYEIVERYSRLPDGYTELEYIESTGTQYIDTGVKIKATQSIEAKIAINDVQDTGWMGSITSASNLVRFGHTGSNIYAQRPFTGGANLAVDTNFHTYKASPTENSIDDTSVATTVTADQTINFCLFAQNDARSDGMSSWLKAKISSFKVWNAQGELVMDLIPAKNASGVVGMYDTVSGQFFTNAGDGEFIAGDPVSE